MHERVHNSGDMMGQGPHHFDDDIKDLRTQSILVSKVLVIIA